jgi:hypothetical protein
VKAVFETTEAIRLTGETKMKYPIFFLTLVLTAATYALGDQKELRFTLSPSGFITTWLMRGPFPNEREGMRDTDYLLTDGGEQKTYSIEEITRLSASDKDYDASKWRPYIADSYLISFNNVFTKTSRVVAYALCFMESSKKQPALIKLGSDDGVKVWLNGKLIHNNPVYRGFQIDEDVVRVELNRGRNMILVKVDQGEGGWGFCLRLTDEFGQPLSNESIALPNLLELSEIENRVAKSVNVSAILGVSSGRSSFTFSLHSEVSLPLVEKILVIKSSITDARGQPIADVVNEKFIINKGVPQKEIIWEPQGLADGMYVLLTKVLDESGRELASKDTPIFWHRY